MLPSCGERLALELAVHRPGVDAAALISEWLTLYPVARADFHRFLLGRAPGHRKIDRHMQRCTDEALAQLA